MAKDSKSLRNWFYPENGDWDEAISTCKIIKMVAGWAVVFLIFFIILSCIKKDLNIFLNGIQSVGVVGAIIVSLLVVNYQNILQKRNEKLSDKNSKINQLNLLKSYVENAKAKYFNITKTIIRVDVLYKDKTNEQLRVDLISDSQTLENYLGIIKELSKSNLHNPLLTSYIVKFGNLLGDHSVLKDDRLDITVASINAIIGDDIKTMLSQDEGDIDEIYKAIMQQIESEKIRIDLAFNEIYEKLEESTDQEKTELEINNKKEIES